MSLINRPNAKVVVFPQETTTDADGNPFTRPDGIECDAAIYPVGTNTERDNGGFHTVEKYRIRLIGYRDELGPQSEIEWRDRRWSVEGYPVLFTRSPQTRRREYVIVRS